MLLGFALSLALVAVIGLIGLVGSTDGPVQRRRRARRVDALVRDGMRDLDRRLAELLRGVGQVD